MKSDLVDIACQLKHETAKAWLINDGTKDVWIPKSQSEIEGDADRCVITIPEWLAKDKGLI